MNDIENKSEKINRYGSDCDQSLIVLKKGEISRYDDIKYGYRKITASKTYGVCYDSLQELLEQFGIVYKIEKVDQFNVYGFNRNFKLDDENYYKIYVWDYETDKYFELVAYEDCEYCYALYVKSY